jgi:hydrogenase maturation factor
MGSDKVGHTAIEDSKNLLDGYRENNENNLAGMNRKDLVSEILEELDIMHSSHITGGHSHMLSKAGLKAVLKEVQKP